MVEELKRQSQSHPDTCIREFYLATLEVLSQPNSPLSQLLEEVLSSRPEISAKHLANLLYRAVQYIFIFKQKRLNFNFASHKKPEWVAELDRLTPSSKSHELLKKLLIEKSTQTTIYQRYAGPKALLSILFGNRPITILDVGCGLNVGLPGLCLKEQFLSIEDKTPFHQFSNFLKAPLNISGGWACDTKDPIQNKNWALACGFYPGELGNFSQFSRFVDRVWSNSPISFVQEDVLNLDLHHLGGHPVDAVIASTVLYQLAPKSRRTALRNTLSLLNEGGYLIINDFVTVDIKVKWGASWFSQNGKSNYRTVILQKKKWGFSLPRTFVSWNNGRCRTAYPGKDFDKILLDAA